MQTLNLPKDESVHNCVLEWWYINGHIHEKEENHSYGFALAVFKFKRELSFFKNFLHEDSSWNNAFQIHFSILEKETKRHYFDVKEYGYTPGFFQLSRKALKIKTPGVYLKKISQNQYQCEVKVGEISLNLNMRNVNGFSFHGKDGVIQMGGVDTSCYYSMPKLNVDGNLRWPLEKKHVQGHAWMDHQWGNWNQHNIFWDWYSIQLDNDMQIMGFHIHNANYKENRTYLTIRYPDGAQKQLQKVEIKKAEYWVSPETNKEYPVKIHVNFLDEKKFQLKLTAISPAQEIRHGFVNYWEGACSVEGRIGDQNMRGTAYFETIGEYNR